MKSLILATISLLSIQAFAMDYDCHSTGDDKAVGYIVGWDKNTLRLEGGVWGSDEVFNTEPIAQTRWNLMNDNFGQVLTLKAGSKVVKLTRVSAGVQNRLNPETPPNLFMVVTSNGMTERLFCTQPDDNMQ